MQYIFEINWRTERLHFKREAESVLDALLELAIDLHIDSVSIDPVSPADANMEVVQYNMKGDLLATSYVLFVPVNLDSKMQ